MVDFPGSNSLDYHAKTFSICGAMNNMIILVIPFTGDVSQLVSEEVARVFSVMKGSDATQVSGFKSVFFPTIYCGVNNPYSICISHYTIPEFIKFISR